MKRKLSILLIAALISIPVISTSAQTKSTPPRSDIETYTIEIGEMYNICPELIQAIIESESSYDPYAKNGNCIGLMQVSQRWHADRMKKLGVTNLYDPYSNILVGTDYLAELFGEAIQSGRGDDLYYVLMRYNLKISTANRLWENGDYSDYAIKVSERAAELEREHGK